LERERNGFSIFITIYKAFKITVFKNEVLNDKIGDEVLGWFV
jgi:hypothetical protein